MFLDVDLAFEDDIHHVPRLSFHEDGLPSHIFFYVPSMLEQAE
jgi:hypothetical protein